MADPVLVVDTGGTFNKAYDPLRGVLENPSSTAAVERILGYPGQNLDIEIRGLIHKDSLDLTTADRETLAQAIAASPARRVIVVHGTDTMDTTARFLRARLADRTIVLTGAMVPFTIDPVEATANLALALGFLQCDPRPGVHIAMHGLVLPFEHIAKDRNAGRFTAR